MLKTKVHVGGLVHLEDARYCAGMGADQLGFSLGKDKVSLQTFEEMAQWIVGPKWVLEIPDDLDHSTFSEVIQWPGIDAIQLRPHQVDMLSMGDIHPRIVLAIQDDEWNTIKGRVTDGSIAQLIVHESVIGKNLSWTDIEGINSKTPVLIHGPCPPTHFDALLQHPIAGIALTAYGSEGEEKEALYKALEALSID